MSQLETRKCFIALHNSQLICFDISFIYLLAYAPDVVCCMEVLSPGGEAVAILNSYLQEADRGISEGGQEGLIVTGISVVCGLVRGEH